MTTPREVTTFCRVCEPMCGMIATVEKGEITRMRPDRDHPITKGFVCVKGPAGIDIHNDPDRLDVPLARTADGSLQPRTWDQAAAEIAAKLRSIIDRDGPGAVAAYIGNPTAFNTLIAPATASFFGQLGTRKIFSSGTQDCANKFAGSEAVFGSNTVHPVPDIDNTDYLLILGENPRVSHMSFMAIANPIGVLKEARKRGAAIRFVNPRVIESAGDDVGDVILIKPDTDLYLLAAMLCEIERTAGFDQAAITAHGKNVDGLRAFVRRYPPERVAPITGIEADTIRRLAREFASAPRASIHMSTGVNMGRQGTLAYWLVHMLSFVTGNLDRQGGNVLSVGFYPSAKAGRRTFERGFFDSGHGKLRAGALPGNLMAEFIEDPNEPIRAMFVVAGNPLLTVGGEQRMRRAMERLELLVGIDIYRNATGELAHYLLPAADMYERADINITSLGLQHRPYVQFTEAVVAPKAERREEWWIFGRLAQAMGLKSPLDHDDPEANAWSRIDHMLGSRDHSLAELKAKPHGIDYGPHQPGDFYTRHLQTDDAKVDCCPAAFAEALQRAERIFAELASRPADQLSLITKRDPFMHNSWYANVERMKLGDRDRNYLFIHPNDAAKRGIADGARVRVSNEYGEVEVETRLSADLMRGVVAMTHGWGNARTSGMRTAQRTPGVNANQLLPTGPGSFEPLSSQAHMTGVPVRVEVIDP
jgi:anaerobic selenocysteine-containing dehydrogenase